MESRNYRDTLLRGIALLGLILILVLGAWGIIVLAFNVPNFLSSAGTSIANLFERDRDDDVVVVPVVSTSTPTTGSQVASPTGSTKTPVVAPKPTYTQAPTVGTGYTYTPAVQPAAQLYGYADLATRIISLQPQGNRYSVVFEISNVGSNIAGYGWSFTAQLPLDPTYTYSSGPQQALRPGDKIVYTLGFDMPYGQNYDRYDDRYEDDERYDECGDDHDNWDAEDWFDWYQDAWDTNSDSREDWDEDEWKDWYDEYCDDRDDRDNDNDYDYDRNGYVSVTANPHDSLYEINRGNNTASQSINYNYYPTYPTYPTYPQYPWVY
mgnify:CR=1 FL=1